MAMAAAIAGTTMRAPESSRVQWAVLVDGNGRPERACDAERELAERRWHRLPSGDANRLAYES